SRCRSSVMRPIAVQAALPTWADIDELPIDLEGPLPGCLGRHEETRPHPWPRTRPRHPGAVMRVMPLSWRPRCSCGLSAGQATRHHTGRNGTDRDAAPGRDRDACRGPVTGRVDGGRVVAPPDPRPRVAD